MPELQITTEFQAAHRALAARLAGLGDAVYVAAPTVLDDGAGTRGATVGVQRGDAPRLERAGIKSLRLTYSDPSTPDTVAALLACIGARGGPVAADPESLSVLALVERLAATDIPVLVGGPTGTGKEVLSRFVHARSGRHAGPFIAVNCAAIPETMLEAMLFGHAKGSFTGANAAGEGFFRAAHGGTLMLDEIAEMPITLQAKLLRALQEGEVVPVGATHPVKVDVRIIAAANRDLPEEVAQGRFREDLYYRLNVFPIMLRPLCERPADIAPLAFAMLLRHAPASLNTIPWLSADAIELLEGHSWPGNVRELENVIRRSLVLSSGAEVISADAIVFDQRARAVPPQPAADEQSGKLSRIVQISEARAIMATLDACAGRRGEAARQLGISERTLRYRMASMRDAGMAVGAGQ